MARIAVAVLIAAGLVAPVVVPTAGQLGRADSSAVWSEADRIAGLAGNTLELAGLAVLVAVPVGTLFAVALEHFPVPGRAVLRALVLAGLFVPLPIVAVAWQVVLGAWLPPLRLDPGDVAWRPWSQGLLPAAWVHGVAALPWVVWIVGAGLRTADRTLEETALLEGGLRGLLRRVILPRAGLAAVAAAGWVAVVTATEIAVTDAMMVRTFAEEVYTQFVSASDGLAAAVAVTLPAWVVAAVAIGWVVRRAGSAFGRPAGESGVPVTIPVGPGVRVAVTATACAAAAVFAGLPLAALVWKAGGGSTADGWAVPYLVGELGKVARSDGAILAGSLATSIMVGLIAAGLAAVACELADGSRWFARGLVVGCVVLAVTPGPLVGLGLKETIRTLLTAEEAVFRGFGVSVAFPPLKSALYDQPSPVPAGWAALIRLFPVAVVVVWPSVRAVPMALREAARLDGLGRIDVWRRVLLPHVGPAVGRAGLAVAALAIGEVSAGKLVNPPFRPAYILRLFDQMHYGADSTVAALCLLQLLVTVTLGGLVLWSFRPLFDRDPRPA